MSVTIKCKDRPHSYRIEIHKEPLTDDFIEFYGKSSLFIGLCDPSLPEFMFDVLDRALKTVKDGTGDLYLDGFLRNTNAKTNLLLALAHALYLNGKQVLYFTLASTGYLKQKHPEIANIFFSSSNSCYRGSEPDFVILDEFCYMEDNGSQIFAPFLARSIPVIGLSTAGPNWEDTATLLNKNMK